MTIARALLAGSLLWLATAHAAELRIGLAADVTSMDPHFLNLQPNVNIGWHVFDALTHVDKDARLIPGLAVSWRTLDATTWEFKLHRDRGGAGRSAHAASAAHHKLGREAVGSSRRRSGAARGASIR